MVDLMLKDVNVESYMNSTAESFMMLMAVENILAQPDLTPENAARLDAWRRLILQSMGKNSPQGGKRRSKKSRKHRN